MQLEFENIGGLKGKHSFELQKGLNLVVARNGRGTSSFIRGLRALIDSAVVSEVLFQDAVKGAVTLSFGGKEYKASVRRTGKGIVITPSELAKDYAPTLPLMVIIDENHPLTFGRLSATSLSSYLSTVSHSENLVKTLEETKTRIAVNESLHSKLVAEERKHNEQIAEYNNLLKDLHKAREKQWAFEDEVKKHPHIKKSSEIIKRLAEEVVRVEKEKKELDKQIRQCDATIASWELQLAPAQKAVTDQRDLHDQLTEKEKIAKRNLREADSIHTILERMLVTPLNECPICRFLNLPCDMKSVSPEELHNCIEKGVATARQDTEEQERGHNRLVMEIQDVKNNLDGAVRMAANVTENIRNNQSQRKEAKSQCEERTKKRSILQTEYNEKGKQLAEAAKLLAEYDLAKQHEQELIAMQKKKFAGGRPLRLSTSQKRRVETNLAKDMRLISETRRALDERLHAVRKEFNAEAAKVMESAGYFKFDKLYIDENYKLIMERNRQNTPQTLSILSTSEVTSIAVLIAAWGKKAYCPNFPFLAIDTVSAFYNIETLRWMSKIALAAGIYVVITRPVDGVETVQIRHDFESIGN
jgi:hypothetical protein